MRFIRPEEGTTRIVKRFLFFPKTLTSYIRKDENKWERAKKVTKWLYTTQWQQTCRITITEIEYAENWGTECVGKWHDDFWIEEGMVKGE